MSFFVSLQKVEGRVASDEELKLTELLRYYMRDIQAAKVRHIYLLPLFNMHRFTTFIKFIYCCLSNDLQPNSPKKKILIEITNTLLLVNYIFCPAHLPLSVFCKHEIRF